MRSWPARNPSFESELASASAEASGVDLDNAPSQTSLEVAVRRQPERLERARRPGAARAA